MAAPKALHDMAGNTPKSAALAYGDNPSTPLSVNALASAIVQLQNTVNEVIARFNAHTHVENTAGSYVQNASTAAPAAGLQVQGASVAATNLFTAS